MGIWADRCVAAGLDAALAAALLTGLSALAMILCRQPARRRTWGRLGLLASLLLLPLALFSPIPKIDLRHPTASFWVLDPHFEPRDLEVAADPATSPPDRPAAAPGSVAPAGRPPRRLDLPWRTAIGRALLVAYGCGLVLGLGRLLLGVAGWSYWVRNASRASARSVELLGSLPFEGGARRPRVLVSDRTGRPVLVGFVGSTILIPPELDRPGLEAKLRLGLLHELAHAEVGDHRWSLVATLAQAVWFFLPQTWWIRGQLRLDAEFLADHRAVGYFGTSYNYAESLVSLAIDPTAGASSAGGPAPEPIRGGLATLPEPHRGGSLASSLLQRVQMLLKCPFEVEASPPRLWSAAVGGIFVGWTLAASCLSLQDWCDRSEGLARASVTEAVRAFHLAELVIAPHRLDGRPFALRFRLPERFRMVCEVMAEPAELVRLEILGYRLGPTFASEPTLAPVAASSAWRQVEITREPGGVEAVQVDGNQLVAPHRPVKLAPWLTIQPIPGRTNRFRNLHLTW